MRLKSRLMASTMISPALLPQQPFGWWGAVDADWWCFDGYEVVTGRGR